MLNLDVLLQKLRLVLFLLLVVWVVAAGSSEIIASLRDESPAVGQLSPLGD